VSLLVIAQKVMTQEKAPSRGLALVKLDFLIAKKWGPMPRARSSKQPGAEIRSGNAPKSEENKDFTSKSLFPKDLAGDSR